MGEKLPRRYMLAPLLVQPRVEIMGMRTPVQSDAGSLARLMCSAYRGTIDDEGEGEDVALVEVLKTFEGEYGTFDSECSKLVERGHELLHATLVTRWQERPFVAFSMTAPAAKRIGLARSSLINVMQDLLELGESELRLVVTLANLPARTLYESLGFAVQE